MNYLTRIRNNSLIECQWITTKYEWLNEIRKTVCEKKSEVQHRNRNQQTKILHLKNAMTGLKNSMENFNSRLDQQKKESVYWKIGHSKLSNRRHKNNNKKKEWKIVKKAYRTYGSSLSHRNREQMDGCQGWDKGWWVKVVKGYKLLVIR